VFEQIKKRDGRIVEFDSSKITAAIAKAGKATGEFGDRETRKLTLRVLTLAHELRLGPMPEVEEIQDIVEHVLLDSPFHSTAKAYIIYREQHAQIRSITTKANVDLVDHYIQRLDWKIKENSNMCYSLQGLNNYISSDVTSEYWLNKIYPPEIRRAHRTGDLHIHDLSILSIYCVGWDLQDLLKNGFKGVEGKVESAPPRHLRSALGQIVNFFYTLQGEAAGAQALSNFDTLLAPFVRYDQLDYKKVKQALQEFIFNINIPTRVGFQTPFTNITMDLYVPAILKDQAVIIAGEAQEQTYGDFQPEMDLINRAFAEVMMEGDARGRVFTFPIPTYNITADFDWDNPNLDPVWQMTAKYGIPYFSNFVNSDMSPEDARSMCCRLRLDNRELLKRGGGLFGANPLTGSIGVVTINLPRIGHLAKSEKEFFALLDSRLNLAVESLTIKRKVLEKFTEKNLYPLFAVLSAGNQTEHGDVLEEPLFHHRHHWHERGQHQLH
jgi:anaerobic ribonucleoside-triphosphate reductase